MFACFWLGFGRGVVVSASLLGMCSIAFGGASIGVTNVKILTYFQRQVPDSSKAVFFAQLQALVSAAQPLGYLVFTVVLAKLAPLTAMGLEGLGILGVGLFLLLNRVDMISESFTPEKRSENTYA